MLTCSCKYAQGKAQDAAPHFSPTGTGGGEESGMLCPELPKGGNAMSEKSDTQLTSISKARSVEEFGDFWDAHSLADYWDQTYEVEFEIRAKRRRRVTLAPEVYAQLEVQARTRGILPETLVNLWLAERLVGEKAA